MTSSNDAVIIIGGGIAGLACARRLHTAGIPFALLEASDRIGGRIRTDRQDGYLMDRGFQVLQTAYPEARQVLDYRRLNLRPFAPGVMIRIRGRFFTIADPRRMPRYLLSSATAPFGTLRDRLRLCYLGHQVSRGPLGSLFKTPEMTAMDFLQARGFSATMIERFFRPFFGGVCLDPQIRASSRVLQYVMRMFATGDAALPAEGMEAIPRQLAAGLPGEWIRTGQRVRSIDDGCVILENGHVGHPRALVVATEAPAARELLGQPAAAASIPETCLYFTCHRAAWHPSFLMLNGEGEGPINNIAFPSQVSATYAPAGRSLASVVVLGNPDEDDPHLATRVKAQLVDWFGPEADRWAHLATYRIAHALPDQSPPTIDPGHATPMVRPGLFVCGEYGRLPGTQWALLSGRRAAEAVIAYLEGR
jgi:phytoene dehydrogenase-like protein